MKLNKSIKNYKIARKAAKLLIKNNYSSCNLEELTLYLYRIVHFKK